MTKPEFKIYDVTLRDGNHALRHKLSLTAAINYAAKAAQCGIDYIEVGHGNGLGGSSVLVGESAHSDRDLISAVRNAAPSATLGVHVMPSFATISRDLIPAIDLGVDVFRVAAHCSEADTTQTQIEFLKSRSVGVAGTLMMISHLNVAELIIQARKMVQYGAEAIIFMDSTGSLTPSDVAELISAAVSDLGVPIGFHAHNNLNLAIANSIQAVNSGAYSIDASICGLGAGAGNAQLELLVAAFEKSKMNTGVSVNEVMRLSINSLITEFIATPPAASPYTALTGINNLFSGFLPIIQKYSAAYNVDIVELITALGGLDLVAGQEDQIESVARHLPKND